MTWTMVFRNILQPFLFIGLFTMTFISMTISIGTEKRAIEKNERDIVKNAELITRNYELLKAAAKGHEQLQRVLDADDVEERYPA